MKRRYFWIGIGTLTLVVSCALFRAATSADPAVAGPAQAKIVSAAGAAGEAVGGAPGHLLATELTAGLLALWNIYQRATESKRHTRHSSARAKPVS